MSNGHYIALVDANRVLYKALEEIAMSYPYSDEHAPLKQLDGVRQAARVALQEVDAISNRNGTTQPNNEMENSNVR